MTEKWKGVFYGRRLSIYELGWTKPVLFAGYVILALQFLLYFGFCDADPEAPDTASRFTGFVMWLFFLAPALKAVGGGFAALKYGGATRWFGIALLLSLLIEYQFLMKALCTFVAVCWATAEAL